MGAVFQLRLEKLRPRVTAAVLDKDPSLLKGPERRDRPKFLQPFTGNGDVSI
jgi:hypothetical protein